MSDLKQKVTDICFENGGVTKPMVDRLFELIEDEVGNRLQKIVDANYADDLGTYDFDGIAESVFDELQGGDK